MDGTMMTGTTMHGASVRFVGVLLTQFVFFPAVHSVIAQESDNTDRMSIMRDAIEKIEVESASATVAKTFRGEPILRFGDATRKTSDGAIWKLGKHRPDAIVAMEFTSHDGRPQINYEFLRLSDEPFVMRVRPGWVWQPLDRAAEFKRLASAPTPATSIVLRTRQIKQLAKKFAATELLDGEDFHLRLMPKPIDQYYLDESKTELGAVFAFANGTNPEVLLMLESSGDGWVYALARMCGASPSVTYDGSLVWQLPSMSEINVTWQLGYTGEAHPID